MKYLFLLLLAAGSLRLAAQDKSVQALKNEAARNIVNNSSDTSKKRWKLGGSLALNVNQGALSNWAAGGDKFSFSLTSLANLYAYYKEGRNSWDNTLDMAFGMVNTTSLGQRKSDDRVDFVSKYGYDIGKKWYLSGLLNFRSQFAKGFAYPTDSTKVLTSNAFSPAYVLLSAGLDYKPNETFSLFLSPATARWVIVTNDELAAVGAFGVDSGKNVKLELGAYASVNWAKTLTPTTTYKTRLDLFSNYRHDPQNVDIFWTNILMVKVSKFINMNLSVDMIYDNDVPSVKEDGTAGGAKPQIKELLGVGFMYKF